MARTIKMIISVCVFTLLFHPHLTAMEKYDFSQYPTYDSIVSMVKSWEKSYKNLMTLIPIGSSYQGKPLYIIALTNRSTGGMTEKPGVLICAGLRGDEAAGVQAALFTAYDMLSRYSSDGEVKKFLDRGTVYICPVLNADAYDYSVRNQGKARKVNSRPVDEDGDGAVDEDGPEDLNKDGLITMMRVKDEKGAFIISEDDARIMLPKPPDTQGKDLYRLICEGSDNDGDKKVNEDGKGGVDLNHNFPSGWKMDYLQANSGMYPGSEPESEALLKFLTIHSNVIIAVAYEGGEGTVFRPFDQLADKEIPKLDMDVYRKLGKTFQETGMEMAVRFQETRSENRTRTGAASRRDTTGSSNKQQRSYNAPAGSFLDWAYKDFGAYSLAPSLWGPPEDFLPKTKSLPDALLNEMGRIAFDEKANSGRGFVEWKKYRHPDLGEVEIGGWVPFYRKNPPPGEHLKKLCEAQASAIVALGEWLPELEIKSLVIKPVQMVNGSSEAVAAAEERGTFRIEKTKKTDERILLAEVKVRIGNSGRLGTRSALGKKTRLAQQPPRSILVTLESDEKNIEILTMPRVLRLGVLEGSDTRKRALEANERRPAASDTETQEAQDPCEGEGKWLIKMTGTKSNLTVKVVSERGGTIVKKFQVRI